MDYLIKMQKALASLERAVEQLNGVDGMEYMVDNLQHELGTLALEIDEYKQHTRFRA